MIDWLGKNQEDLSSTSITSSSKKLSTEPGQSSSKLFLHRLLLKPEDKELFNKIYSKHIECLICHDILFDPITCIQCRGVYCKECIAHNIKEVDAMDSYSKINSN